VIKITIVN